MHYYCHYFNVFIYFNISTVWVYLPFSCMFVCVTCVCRCVLHDWTCRSAFVDAEAGVWCVGPLTPASYMLSIPSSPVYCRHFCTLSLYVSSGIMDLRCRWVFTADVLNTEPTVAFIWENIFVHKRKRASVSDHLQATEDDRRHLQLSYRPEFYTPGGAHSSTA